MNTYEKVRANCKQIAEEIESFCGKTNIVALFVAR